VEAINTSYYVLNRVTLRLELKRTYELWKGRKSIISNILVQNVLFSTPKIIWTNLIQNSM
jgi:hypothetical protein